jgi:nucleotide-binding universal stress UspA family protein
MSDPLYKTILVPTDLSDPSMSAVRQAAALADRLGGRLVLTYVMEDRLPAMILAHTAETEQQLLERHRENARESLNAVAAELLAGLDVQCIVRQGVDHQEIVALAKEIDADLIVVGMHGHGFLVHALAGSTTERVLHHAPCPVLVVGQSDGQPS